MVIHGKAQMRQETRRVRVPDPVKIAKVLDGGILDNNRIIIELKRGVKGRQINSQK
jgi:hypothetical protein